jgi:hypothetical protein
MPTTDLWASLPAFDSPDWLEGRSGSPPPALLLEDDKKDVLRGVMYVESADFPTASFSAQCIPALRSVDFRSVNTSHARFHLSRFACVVLD